MRKWSVVLPLLMVVACQPRSGEPDRASRKVIQNKGSDTLVNVAQAWAENYKDVNPNVAVAVTGGGSGTGISALINGTVDIANASRKMKEKEIELARTNGIEPVESVVGFDALAVFLHADNPIEAVHDRPAGGDLRRGGRDRELGSARASRSRAAAATRSSASAARTTPAPTSTSRRRCWARSATTSWAPATCTAPRTSWTWWRTRPAPSATAGWPMPPSTSRCRASQPTRAVTASPRPSRPRIDGSYPIARPLLMYTRRRAGGRGQGVPGLDPERRGPVHHPGEGLRPGHVT